jgi:hypothetical protein
MGRTGLAPGGDDLGVRWVAVRHAPDHIHIVATLARQDRGRPDLWNGYYKLLEACRDAETRFGLRSTAPADRTAAKRPARAETEQAARRRWEEPPRVTLRREVCTAAAGGWTEQEFDTAVVRRGPPVCRPDPAPAARPLGSSPEHDHGSFRNVPVHCPGTGRDLLPCGPPRRCGGGTHPPPRTRRSGAGGRCGARGGGHTPCGGAGAAAPGTAPCRRQLRPCRPRTVRADPPCHSRGERVAHGSPADGADRQRHRRDHADDGHADREPGGPGHRGRRVARGPAACRAGSCSPCRRCAPARGFPSCSFTRAAPGPGGSTPTWAAVQPGGPRPQ